jgi:hypothetical protein
MRIEDVHASRQGPLRVAEDRRSRGKEHLPHDTVHLDLLSTCGSEIVVQWWSGPHLVTEIDAPGTDVDPVAMGGSGSRVNPAGALQSAERGVR